MSPTEDRADGLIQCHGGYRNLKTFQIATVIYDVTVRFCEKYLDPRSRTVDQMIQAARSGRQNIAEGSMDAATSKKSEMKLTGIARGSLDELRLDYEDFLRQRNLPQWPPEHPSLVRFRARRYLKLDDFRLWVADEIKLNESADAAVLAANGALSLLNICIYLLDRQIKAQGTQFESTGGFTERLYRRRQQRSNSE